MGLRGVWICPTRSHALIGSIGHDGKLSANHWRRGHIESEDHGWFRHRPLIAGLRKLGLMMPGCYALLPSETSEPFVASGSLDRTSLASDETTATGAGPGGAGTDKRARVDESTLPVPAPRRYRDKASLASAAVSWFLAASARCVQSAALSSLRAHSIVR